MLEFSEHQALYLQLADYLETDIRLKMAPHDKLMSERELTEQHQVSRITVRQALQELEIRGLIYKKQGKGTFVSDIVQPSVDLSLVYSFTDHMKKIGKQPSTQILSFKQIDASETLAKNLSLPVGTSLYELERLRLADDVPLIFERSYLPTYLIPDLEEERLRQKPLYDILKNDYQQPIRSVEEEFSASIALDRESDLLHIKHQSPVLHIVRKSYNQKNLLIEYTFSIARADQFKYKVGIKGKFS